MATQVKKYTDLDPVFQPNLITGDLALRSDISAINFSIKSLILTKNYERPFQSSIGSQTYKLLFEPMDDLTKIVLAKAIKQTLVNHEPRIVVLDVNVNYNEDTNTAVIDVTYRIITMNIVNTLSIALERTR